MKTTPSQLFHDTACGAGAGAGGGFLVTGEKVVLVKHRAQASFLQNSGAPT